MSKLANTPTPAAKTKVSVPSCRVSEVLPTCMPNAVLMLLVLTPVTRPFASTVITGTAVPLPYVPAVTPLLASVKLPVAFALPSMFVVQVASPVILILRLAAHVLAVVALPLSAAVIVPAVKLPLASRRTSVLAVLLDVAAVI